MTTAPSLAEVFDAQDLASGVARCAIEVVAGPSVSLVAVFDAEQTLAGRYRFSVVVQSGAGRSVSQQSGRFENGNFEAPRMTVNADAELLASLHVIDTHGEPLCELELQYPTGATALRNHFRSGADHG